VSAWLCQTNSPSTLTTITSCPLNVATVRGDQCSVNWSSFAARLIAADSALAVASVIWPLLQSATRPRTRALLRLVTVSRSGCRSVLSAVTSLIAGRVRRRVGQQSSTSPRMRRRGSLFVRERQLPNPLLCLPAGRASRDQRDRSL